MRRLRTRLFLLATAAIVPLAIMSGIGLFLHAEQQYKQVYRTALEISRALVTGVDADLGQSLGVLEAMATSPLIDSRAFSEYHAYARRVAGTRPNWLAVILFDLNGQPLLNSRYPYGQAPNRIIERGTYDQVLRTAKPVVGNLTKTPDGGYAFAVRVPVLRNGQLRYVLTAVVKPESVLEVVMRQRVPQDWVISTFDAAGSRTARSRDHQLYVGGKASASLKQLMDERGLEGFGKTLTLDEEEVFTAFSKSPETGWSVAIGIPVHYVATGTWRPLAVFTGGVVLSILLAVVAAILFARGINRPIDELTAAARALGRGEPPTPPATDIHELRVVSQALFAASAQRARDEAERERLFAREQEARTAAEAANRAKDEFLAMLGHELRNPLSAIANSMTLLNHPRADAETTARARAIIGRQIEHLSHLTDDLLDAARAVTGKITLHRTQVNLATVAAATLAALRPQTINHRIEQNLESAWVNADPTRLEQIISNLVVNAVKYTPAGGTIRVSVTKADGQAVLRVADNGIGMPPELIERVFELFAQGSRGLDRPHGGLGIGLTLVRRLADLHGGSAEAKSAGPNQGSEFIVRLPLSTEVAPTRPDTSISQPVTPRDVLVIEDNADARESLSVLLELSGHRVRTAADGESGLQAALATRPDIALVDIGLPKMDGYEVARRIRASYDAKTAPLLVALTGYGLSEDSKRVLEAGFDIHLVKPVDQTKLEKIFSGVTAHKTASH